MSTPRRPACPFVLALSLAACATRVQVPEIPILDSPAFSAAKREPEPKRTVEYIEVPKPLPLPGQLKPVPKKLERIADDKPPKDRIVGANAAARVERPALRRQRLRLAKAAAKQRVAREASRRRELDERIRVGAARYWPGR